MDLFWYFLKFLHPNDGDPGGTRVGGELLLDPPMLLAYISPRKNNRKLKKVPIENKKVNNNKMASMASSLEEDRQAQ